METTEINSISDLSKILQTLGEPEKGHTRFFRGHGDEGWQMLPSIYRETSLIENEDKIIKDALTYCPDDFLPSDTLFEKLVKLQHYGYSTRLLDLTTNALVALYFAAQPYKEKKPYSDEYKSKDGELIIFDIPNEHIKYGDSDTVAILSAISTQKNEFSILKAKTHANNYKNLAKHAHALSQEFKNDSYDFGKNIKENRYKEMLLQWSNFSSNIKPIIEENNKKIIEEKFLTIFNNNKEITSLLHDIQADKPSFRPLIHPDDLERVLCVRAKLNNARISRQQGCFLLFGINGSKTKAAAIPAKWHPSALKNQKILIKAESKAAIMQELQSFGISKRTLFPELEAQAKEIRPLAKIFIPSH